MPRKNYGTRQARRRNTTFGESEQSEYEILMTNGSKVKRITVKGASGPNAWNRASKRGLNEDDETMPGVWWPIEVSRDDWSYAAR